MKYEITNEAEEFLKKEYAENVIEYLKVLGDVKLILEAYESHPDRITEMKADIKKTGLPIDADSVDIALNIFFSMKSVDIEVNTRKAVAISLLPHIKEL